jgi:hypothetical protein
MRVIKEFLRKARTAIDNINKQFLSQNYLLIAKQYENVTQTVILGALLGLPVASTYYTLQLIPYFVNDLEAWKKRQMMEKDIFEELGRVHLD